MKLSQAFRLNTSSIVAIAGGGGKTSALAQLARELSPCIVTNSAHLAQGQISEAGKHFILPENSGLPQNIEQFLGSGIVLVTGEPHNTRYRGVTEAQLALLKELAGYHDLPLLVEADGSRQKPLKAPAEHEPAIPPFASTVVYVAGMQGIGKPLRDENIHRAELYSLLCENQIGEPVTAEAAVKVLTLPKGGLKNIPVGARRIALLNQADTPDLQAVAGQMAQKLLGHFDAVVISSLQPTPQIFAVHEKIAGIILAAGSASRFGQPKQLLDFHGKPFVRALAETALAGGLDPVVVVTGAHGEEVARAVEGLPVEVVQNKGWEQGQSGSIVAGVRHILGQGFTLTPNPSPARRGEPSGAVFLLADQPQVTPGVIRALVEHHANGLFPIVAPLVEDRRANPVLFDGVTFKDLLALTGDVGGRAIFSKYRVEYIDWLDSKLLIDVDTPTDYKRLIEDEF